MRYLLRQVKLQSWLTWLSISGRKLFFVAFVISKYVIFEYQQRNKHFLLYMHRLFAFILWVNLVFRKRIPPAKSNPNECKGSEKLRPCRWGSEPFTLTLQHRHYGSLGFSWIDSRIELCTKGYRQHSFQLWSNQDVNWIFFPLIFFLTMKKKVVKYYYHMIIPIINMCRFQIKHFQLHKAVCFLLEVSG